MAHELDFTKGFAAIAYAGATPWHGHGTNMQLRPDASLQDWINASGLDYEIMRACVQYATAQGIRRADGNDVLYRSDNGSHVGIVSDGYNVVQPATIAAFFEDACRAHGYKLETMGALRNGAVYWALARTGQVMGEARGDPIHGFVLISTSADGSASTVVQQTSVRVVCANTLAIAHQSSRGAVRVRHSTTFNPEQVKEQMGLLDLETSWDAFRENMTKLAQTKVTPDEAKQFMAELLRPSKPKAQPKGAQSFAELMTGTIATSAEPVAVDKDERAIRGFADLMRSYETAPGAVPGSAYGLVQGVTHFVDHVRGSDSKRLQSSWFGQGASLKERALESALTYADLRAAAH